MAFEAVVCLNILMLLMCQMHNSLGDSSQAKIPTCMSQGGACVKKLLCDSPTPVQGLCPADEVCCLEELVARAARIVGGVEAATEGEPVIHCTVAGIEDWPTFCKTKCEPDETSDFIFKHDCPKGLVCCKKRT